MTTPVVSAMLLDSWRFIYDEEEKEEVCAHSKSPKCARDNKVVTGRFGMGRDMFNTIVI